MIPITKNIVVVDEQGMEYEATYAKRARGLVKKGRARFVDENTICLACPPINDLEDNNMSENINKPDNHSELTMDYVLNSIDGIIKDSSYIHEAIGAIRDLDVIESPCGDDRSNSISAAVQSRETTNQQLLRLLEKMYDDLKPEKQGLKQKALLLIERALNSEYLSTDERMAIIDSIGPVKEIIV